MYGMMGQKVTPACMPRLTRWFTVSIRFSGVGAWGSNVSVCLSSKVMMVMVTVHHDLLAISYSRSTSLKIRSDLVTM